MVAWDVMAKDILRQCYYIYTPVNHGFVSLFASQKQWRHGLSSFHDILPLFSFSSSAILLWKKKEKEKTLAQRKRKEAEKAYLLINLQQMIVYSSQRKLRLVCFGNGTFLQAHTGKSPLVCILLLKKLLKWSFSLIPQPPLSFPYKSVEVVLPHVLWQICGLFWAVLESDLSWTGII